MAWDLVWFKHLNVDLIILALNNTIPILKPVRLA